MFQKYTNYPIWGGLLVRFCIILDNLLMIKHKKGGLHHAVPLPSVCYYDCVCM